MTLSAADENFLQHARDSAAAPVGSLFRGAMTEIPSITGGAAAPSAAAGGKNSANIYSVSGGGGWLWLSMVAIVWMVLHHKKKI